MYRSRLDDSEWPRASTTALWAGLWSGLGCRCDESWPLGGVVVGGGGRSIHNCPLGGVVVWFGLPMRRILASGRGCCWWGWSAHPQLPSGRGCGSGSGCRCDESWPLGGVVVGGVVRTSTTALWAGLWFGSGCRCDESWPLGGVVVVGGGPHIHNCPQGGVVVRFGLPMRRILTPGGTGGFGNVAHWRFWERRALVVVGTPRALVIGGTPGAGGRGARGAIGPSARAGADARHRP